MRHYRRVIDEQQVAGLLGKRWPPLVTARTG